MAQYNLAASSRHENNTSSAPTLSRLSICGNPHILPVMDQAARLFSALADSGRLRLILLLLAHGEGVCVCELVDALRLPQYEVSRQLRILRECGLVVGGKRGAWVYYRIPSHPEALVRSILGSLAHLLPTESTPREDWGRFKRRLSLRKDGACVIGYELDRPFREKIPVTRGRRDGAQVK